jgi:hypothetical protein
MKRQGSLVIYGAIIPGSRVREFSSGNYPLGAQLTSLHAAVRWGAVLLALGVFYAAKFAPRGASK